MSSLIPSPFSLSPVGLVGSLVGAGVTGIASLAVEASEAAHRFGEIASLVWNSVSLLEIAGLGAAAYLLTLGLIRWMTAQVIGAQVIRAQVGIARVGRGTNFSRVLVRSLSAIQDRLSSHKFYGSNLSPCRFSSYRFGSWV